MNSMVYRNLLEALKHTEMSLRVKPCLPTGREAISLLGLPHTLRVFAMTNEMMKKLNLKS
jgi:hypothetical protein